MNILSFAYLSSDYIINSNSGIKKRDDGELATSIKRDQVYNEKFTSFKRLPAPDKLSFSVASLAISSYPNFERENCGIILINGSGSVESDEKFMASVIEKFPRPNIFPSTLPSSPIAEIAITFGLQGPNLVFVGKDKTYRKAIDIASLLIKKDNCKNLLFIICHSNNENYKDDFAVSFLLDNSNNLGTDIIKLFYNLDGNSILSMIKKLI